MRRDNKNALHNPLPRTLRRVRGFFAAQVGVTFIDYFTMVRITSAKRMLLQTDKKIVDIATEVGFSDYRYFSRVFRKYAGKTPSEFKTAFR